MKEALLRVAKQLGILREHREVLAQISREGVDADELRSAGYDGHVSAREFAKGEHRPEEFTPSTVILNNGYGIWKLRIPEHIRSRLVSAMLRVDTIRTHGMLHSAVHRAAASVLLNGQLVDKIYLVKPHPHGEDYGVDSRRPIQVLRYLDTGQDTQILRLEVDETASWDVDEVSIEPTVLRHEVTSGAWMILGAVISAILGVIGTLWLQAG